MGRLDIVYRLVYDNVVMDGIKLEEYFKQLHIHRQYMPKMEENINRLIELCLHDNSLDNRENV